MPGLYGYSGNSGNVAVSNTPGLYINSGASPIISNAQQLLDLLSNNGTVIFQLDPATGYSQVEAFATGGGGGGGNVIITLVGAVTGTGSTGAPLYTTISPSGVTPGTYGSSTLIPVFTVNAAGQVSSVTNVGFDLSTYTGNLSVKNIVATGNISSSGNISSQTLFVSGNATILGNLNLTGNVFFSNTRTNQNTINTTTILANATINSISANTGTIISYGGIGAHLNITSGGNIQTNNNVIADVGVYSNQYYWANGTPFLSSSYGNSNVAAYLTGSITVGNITVGNIYANTYAYANGVNILDSINSNIQSITSNLGAFEIYSNANAASQATSINTINANLGAYQIYANANIGTISTSLQTLNANVGAFETLVNQEIYSITAGFNSNVGAYLLGNTVQGNISANAVNIQGYGSNVGGYPYYSGYLQIDGGNGGTNGPSGTSYGPGPVFTVKPDNGHDFYGYTYTNIGSYNTSSNSPMAQANGSLSQINLNGNILVPNSLFVGSGAFLDNIGYYNSLNKPAAMFEGPVYFNFYNNNTNNSRVQIGSAVAILGSGSNLSVSSSANINLTGPGNMYTTTLSGGGNIYLGTGTYIVGDGSKLTGITGTYSNANVASYLTTATINTTGNLQASNVLTNNHLFANGVNILTTVAGTYSNANVASYLASNTDSTISNLNANAAVQAVALNTLNANVGAFETYANLTFSTSNYGNTQAAAWIKIDPTITALQANIGAFEIYSNANASSQATSINTINANIGAFETYANLTFSTGGGSSYGNANVAAYLTGSITVGNIKSTSGYFWANGVNYSSTVPGTYTNSNVTNLLSGGTYGGDINAPTGVVTAAAINSTGQITAATYLQATNGLYSTGAITEAYTDGIVVDYTSGNGRISVGSADAVTFYSGGPGTTPTTVIYPNGNVVVPGSLTMTNGIFWANGTAYSSGGGSYGNTQVAAYLPTDPTIYGIQANIGAFETYANATFSTGSSSFSGNLAGNTLVDSVNLRVLVNASPYSAANVFVPYVSSGTTKSAWPQLFQNAPVYTNGVLTPPGSIQAYGTTTGQATISNIALQSSYGQGGNKTISGSGSYVSVTPFTANNMNNLDRVRGILGVTEVNPAGKTWGTMSSAAITTSPIAGITGYAFITGTGEISQAVGFVSGVVLYPTGGSANVQYATGLLSQISGGTAGYGATSSNIAFARLVGGTISPANNTIPTNILNAIGLHIHNGWAANASSSVVTNRYAVLNEDATSLIQSAGNIVANTGAYFLGDGSKLTNVATSTQLQTLDANVGAFETYANVTFQTTAYGNTQVAAYLPTYAGNIGGTLTTASQPYITTLANATNIGSSASSLSLTGGAATLALNGYGQTLSIQTNQISAQTDFNTHEGNITINGDTANKGHLIVGNTARAATYYTTTGYFWANGTAYSTGGGSYGNTQVAAYLPTDPTIYGIQANIGAFETYANTAITNAYFSGNLLGNTLTDSISQRIFANASPQSPQYFRGGSYFGNAAASAYSGPISYTGSNIVTSSGVSALQVQANLTMQSAYGTSRTVYGQAVLAQLFGITANTMTNTDRIRALSGVAEVYPQGLTWGTMNSVSQNAFTIGGTNGIVNAVGTGNVSALVGQIGVAYVAPDQGSLNAQYVTGSFNQIGYNLSNATNRGASYITYARLFTGAISSGGQANLVIINSIGLHTHPYWHANVSATTNRWAVLNEDTTSTIQTSGNIVISASTGTPKSGFMQFGVYPNASLPAVGVAGQVIAISDPANTAVNPAGSLAYWDTTNNRWSYVATNTVVP